MIPRTTCCNGVVVKQGDKIIYDTGIVDFGPAGPIKYPVDVILFTDANFGYWPGAQDGPNNGNCSGNLGYPLTAPSFPSAAYVLASNSYLPTAGGGSGDVHDIYRACDT